MRHYHGARALDARAIYALYKNSNALVSYTERGSFNLLLQVVDGFIVHYGGYNAPSADGQIKGWDGFYNWVSELKHYHHFDFAIIPDSIDGDESDSDAILNDWPFPRYLGAAVWHTGDSLERLERLVSEWPIVAIGSSPGYVPNSLKWWHRIKEASRILYDERGRPRVRIHGISMLNPNIFTKLPLHSADSTGVVRTAMFNDSWAVKSAGAKYVPSVLHMRIALLRHRLESFQTPLHCDFDKLKYTVDVDNFKPGGEFADFLIEE